MIKYENKYCRISFIIIKDLYDSATIVLDDVDSITRAFEERPFMRT